MDCNALARVRKWQSHPYESAAVHVKIIILSRVVMVQSWAGSTQRTVHCKISEDSAAIRDWIVGSTNRSRVLLHVLTSQSYQST